MRAWHNPLPLLFCLGIVELISFQIVFAHHSPARFSQTELVNISGRIVDYDWRNPHVYISVADEAGREWLLEANATSNLSRNGWHRESFTKGDRVYFEAHANVNPESTHVGLISITGVDGKTMNSRIGNNIKGNEADPASAESLEGIWTGDANLAFGFLFSTFDHPVTAKAEEMRSQFDESMDPAADCVVWPTPRLTAWNAFYPILVEYVEDSIVFTSEYGGVQRVIHMDGRDHPEDGKPTNQGHSIGHWDGEVLVVDTRLFADHASPIADGVPSGQMKHVVERFTFTGDRSALDVDVFVEDPEFLLEPLRGQLEWRYAPEMPFAPFECEPDVASRFAE